MTPIHIYGLSLTQQHRSVGPGTPDKRAYGHGVFPRRSVLSKPQYDPDLYHIISFPHHSVYLTTQMISKPDYLPQSYTVQSYTHPSSSSDSRI